MNTSQAVQDISLRVGASKLAGAIIFVGIDRPLDHLICQAEGLDSYHRGTPSHWSHCFLLLSRYQGPATPILDCTIRDPKDPRKLLFETTLEETVKMLTKRAGGIYLARLGDYDHPKVSPVGMKVIQTLSDAQRQAICSAGAELREEGYSYDLPGLVRELAHLCLGISIPAEPHMLFCSAFCQEAYRRALGEAGDFAPRHAVTDVTPDDIWYSARGVRLLPRGLTVRMEGGAS